MKRETYPEIKIVDLRKKLDQIDCLLLDLLKKRFEIIVKIIKIKKENKIPIMQHKRIDEILDNVQKFSLKNSINETFLSNIFKSIIKESIKFQKKFIF